VGPLLALYGFVDVISNEVAPPFRKADLDIAGITSKIG
jgi:hypothetical protein